ncbi:MAG: FtsL-like putative cell division protein [Chitinophagales bacterium]|nr:FtsL-like putative cell division protein [Chitinophagales bacterium]
MNGNENIDALESKEIAESETALWQQIKEDLLNLLGVGDLLNYSVIIKRAFFFCFLICIVLFHIYNSHKAVRMINDKNKLEAEIKELEWEKLSIKSDMLKKSMFSKIENDIEPLGLKPLLESPYKIVDNR